MKKMLFISNIANKIGSFSIASVTAAREINLEFQMAAYWNLTRENRDKLQTEFGVKLHHINLERSPYSLRNFKAYKQLVKIIREEKIDYIHCNTPVGGILGRLAGKKCNVKKVIYQAHGFHFYKGSPKKNWLLYYPVEKWLARYTDALITINQEDYELAKAKFKLRDGGSVYYVPGVGIDTSEYNTEAKFRDEKRKELGLESSDVALISMGDLIERKNYEVAIRSVARAKNDKLHYFICGKGPKEYELKRLAESLNVTQQIHFLGYRSDIKELLEASDIFLFTTKQEGLPRSMMEAMASGLPCIASKIRGNTDLIANGEGGYLVDPRDVDGFTSAIKELIENDGALQKMRKSNLETIKKFDIAQVRDKIKEIYLSII